MQWLHHQCELGGDIVLLRFRVGLFRRILPVKFHQTSHLSHVSSAVNMKSQFDIYFISGKVFRNKTCSKLTRISNIRVHWKMLGSHSQGTPA
jgi:hypothetical protein